MVDNIEKKSLLKIDTDLLPDYIEFYNANDDWNIEKHLNLNYDIDAALAFSKLYFPTFIIHKQCIILESRFDESIFNDWFIEFNGDIPQIEKMCNLYEIKDLFHINNSNQTIEKVKELGKSLKTSWDLNLKLLFPKKEIEVRLFEEDGDEYITLSSI